MPDNRTASQERMQLRDIMATPVVTAKLDENLETVAKRLLQHRVGSVVVVDRDGKAAGIITETDFAAHEPGVPLGSFERPRLWGHWIGEAGLENLYAEARRIKAHRVMKTTLVALEEGEPPERAVDLMLRHGIKHLPVLRDGKPVGMVAHHDLLKLIGRARPAAA